MRTVHIGPPQVRGEARVMSHGENGEFAPTDAGTEALLTGFRSVIGRRESGEEFERHAKRMMDMLSGTKHDVPLDRDTGS